MNTKHSHNENEAVPQSRRKLADFITVSVGALATLVRLGRHPANFSPVGALGLFGGARLRAWLAYAVPLGMMILTDFGLWLLTGYDYKYAPWHISRLYVYPAFMIYVLLGRALIRNRSFWWIGVASLVGSLQFFIVTNFFTWLMQPLQALPESYRYSRDLSGLLSCFVAAIPFYQSDAHFDVYHFFIVGDLRYAVFYTFLSDLCFSAALFGLEAGLLRILSPLPASTGRSSEERLLVQTAASRDET
jgi:hypothetical protein